MASIAVLYKKTVVQNDFYSEKRSSSDCSVFSLVLGLSHMLPFFQIFLSNISEVNVAKVCNSSYLGGETLVV